MSITQDLRIAGRRWAQLRKAPPGQPATVACESERAELRRSFQDFARSIDPHLVRDAKIFEIEASQMPWFDTGIDLEEGESVSTFAAGRVVLSDPLDVWVGPQFQLWMRVGERGLVFNGTRETNSFPSLTGGRLYLANYFPGQWGDVTGRISTSLTDYRKSRGGMTVVVVRWNGEAADCVEKLTAAPACPEWLAAEKRRLDERVPSPAGWEYLWFLGRSEIFRPATEEGHACIACHTERNVGILQRDAVFDLSAGTRLRWSWKVDELPSLLPENTALSHDYLSVAVEFENGRDITYTWSPELPVGTGYWCPLPTWRDREFHVVIRSGSQSLGTWINEERDLEADYRRYMGEPPRRVVRIWLIAVTLFQRRKGRAFFRDFVLESSKDGRRLAID